MPNLLYIFAGPRLENPLPLTLVNRETGEVVPVHILGLDRKRLYREVGSCRDLINAEFPLALETSPEVTASGATMTWVSPTLRRRFGPDFGLTDFPPSHSFGNGCTSGAVLIRGHVEHLSWCVLSDAGALQAQASPAMLERLRQIFED